jgi:TRAP-type C4-dicarboxylate transport system permease small subunit
LRIAAVALGRLNRVVVALSMVAVIAACLVLTAGVVMRYFFNTPTDWQDEISMFLLVGSIFSCGAAVQAQRGHIGIEAVAGLLPPGINRLRLWLCDATSLLFCVFFSWKSWTLLHEAWAEGMTTSSTWAPPLWIPYGLMSAGMTLLSLQLLIQVLSGPHRARGEA